MIVRIGNSEFNSDSTQIEIQLTDREKLEILNMPVDHDIYKRVPTKTTQEAEILEIKP